MFLSLESQQLVTPCIVLSLAIQTLVTPLQIQKIPNYKKYLDNNKFRHFTFTTLHVRPTGIILIVVRVITSTVLILNFGLLWQRSKCTGSPIISYFRISNWRHTCPKLNFVLISRLTGKCTTQNLKKNLRNTNLSTC